MLYNNWPLIFQEVCERLVIYVYVYIRFPFLISCGAFVYAMLAMEFAKLFSQPLNGNLLAYKKLMVFFAFEGNVEH